MKSLMTIVVPCYNEEEALPLFMEAVGPIREQLRSEDIPCDTELIFVDDGSSDCTLSLLRSFNAADASVRYVSFSRNFGKEAGIYAGLSESKGDYVVLLDADLQHPVEYIPTMYRILAGIPDADNSDALSGACTDTAGKPADPESAVTGSPDRFDSVAMYRADRKGEGRIRSFFSRRFYRTMNKLSRIDLVDGATDYRMMTRKMVDAVLSVHEYNRFTKGIFNWVGFSTKWLPYSNVPRCAGKSKWSFGGLLRYGLEGMFAFSTTPLTISFTLGIILCILALLFALYTVIKTIIWGDPVAGFPSVFTMILLLGGIQLLFLGIMGQYMSRMYLETKERPLYIIRESSDETTEVSE